MSINLVELLKEQLSGQLIEKAAALLGESTESVGKGLLGSSGALLASLAGKLSDSDQGESVFNGLGSGNILNSLGQQLAGGNDTVRFLSEGLDSAKGLLGDHTDALLSSLSSATGLRSESSSSLLGMAAPIVTGLLGKQKAAGMSLSAMSNLLSSQADSFAGLLPDGMDTSSIAKLAGTGGIMASVAGMADKATDLVGDAVENVGDLAGAAVSTVGDAASDVAGAAINVTGAAANKVGDVAGAAVEGASDLIEAGAGGLGKIIPWLLAALAALFAFFFLRSCNDGGSMTDAMKNAANSTTEMVKDASAVVSDTAGAAVDTAGDAASATLDAAGDAASATAEMAGNAVDATGEALGNAAEATGDMLESGVDALATIGKKIGDKFRFALPGGVEVDVPEGSFEANLLKSFAEGDAEYGKAFVLDRIYFESGSYDLTAESADQLQTMSAIMSAYPELTANLRGHTDNTGSADGNLSLSLNRANAVKAYLENLGVAAERLTSTGKGSAEPIADNATAEGRALNRRIDISFTK